MKFRRDQKPEGDGIGRRASLLMDAPVHMELHQRDTWARPNDDLCFHRAGFNLSKIEAPFRVTANVIRISQAELMHRRGSRVRIAILSH